MRYDDYHNLINYIENSIHRPNHNVNFRTVKYLMGWLIVTISDLFECIILFFFYSDVDMTTIRIRRLLSVSIMEIQLFK